MNKAALLCLVLCACTHHLDERAVKAEPARCQIVPLRLLVDPSGHPERAWLALDEKGDITSAMRKESTPLARLDPRGCIISSDGVEVELTSKGQLWTTNERLLIERNTLQLGNDGALRIADDGSLERLGPDGTIEKNPYGSLRFEGYRPEARCAALLLTGVFLQTIPSMAASDGVLKKEPAPEPSVCADLRAASATP